MSIISRFLESFSKKKDENTKEYVENAKKELSEAIKSASEDGTITSEEITKIEEMQEEFSISNADLGDIKINVLKNFIKQAIDDNLVTQEEMDFIASIEKGLNFNEEEKEAIELEMDGVRKMFQRSKEAIDAMDLASAKSYFREAKVNMRNKDFEGAILEFSQVLDVMESPAAHYKRGLCYFYVEQKEKACEDWKKAQELGYEQATEKIKEHC